MKNAIMVILSCEDQETEKWNYVSPGDVPDWLKDPEAMGRLVGGEILQAAGSDTFYRGEQVEAIPV